MNTQQARHVNARAFARIVRAVQLAADLEMPAANRDRTRKGTDKGDAMRERRNARRAKAAARFAFLDSAR